jgi:hypothetical protein
VSATDWPCPATVPLGEVNQLPGCRLLAADYYIQSYKWPTQAD